jgi:hypothetical protein
VTEATVADRSVAHPTLERHYFWVLATLLFLFCLRVFGQILVAFFNVSFLPPMEEWFSGLLPYPELLTAQILIIAIWENLPRLLLWTWFFRNSPQAVGDRPADLRIALSRRDDPSLRHSHELVSP